MSRSLKKICIAVVPIAVFVLLFPCCRNSSASDGNFRADTAQVNEWLVKAGKVKFKEYGDPSAGDSARAYFNKAIALSRQVGYPRGVVQGYLGWGSMESKLGREDQGRLLLDSALAAAGQYHYDSLTGRTYRAIATTYFIQQDFEQGEPYILKAIDWFEKNARTAENIHYLVLSYNDLAGVCLELDQPQRSLTYSKKAVQLASDQNDYMVMAHSLENMCVTYTGIDSFAAAEATANKVLALAKEHGLRAQEELGLRRLGEVYIESDPPKALPLLERSLAIAKESSALDEMVLLYDISKLYIKQQKYKLAEQYLNNTDSFAVRLGNRIVMRDVHGLLSEAYYGEKRYKEGYDEQLAFLKLKDTLDKNEHDNKMQLLEVKFRTAEKDKSIAESDVQIARQKEKIARENIWLVSIAAIMVLLVIFSWILNRNRRRIQAEKLKTLKKEEKVNMLLSAMRGEEKERSRLANELHDGIGGLLSTVKMYFSNVQAKEPALIVSPEYKEAMSLLDQTLTELRKTAHNLMPDLLLKNELPDALRQLCNTIQNANSIKVSFQYYGFVGRLNTNFELFIYRITQELLQNIVKHAHATEAIVQISIHNDIFCITVEDNGVGIRSDAENDGMGLKTIRNRVEEISGSFMVSSGRQGGTSVYLEIDIKNNEKFDVFAAAFTAGADKKVY